MALLSKLYTTKLKASSLTEVLVATVIILLIFAIAMATIDNVLFNSVKNKTHFIETELNQLVYEYKNGKIKLPYSSEEKNWFINSIITTENNTSIIIFEATHSITKQKITKKTTTNDAT